jgi:hypothetical protein
MKSVIFVCLLIGAALAAPIEKKDDPAKPLIEAGEVAAPVKPEEPIKVGIFLCVFIVLKLTSKSFVTQ